MRFQFSLFAVQTPDSACCAGDMGWDDQWNCGPDIDISTYHCQMWLGGGGKRLVKIFYSSSNLRMKIPIKTCLVFSWKCFQTKTWRNSISVLSWRNENNFFYHFHNLQCQMKSFHAEANSLSSCHLSHVSNPEKKKHVRSIINTHY